ncbi:MULTISPECIES: helix-turn-helix domain-containing protein [Rahnella]|uniref:Helix-turn-helix domain-containing protein n=1 Tax=Rahnella laticis TaxID=2787622 RepID=A0ABS0E3R8_9GAMM|nr:MULTISPECIES: helix-turn-helix domain-containing protein [Rahnella]MBF7978813.1 helix-turn-helix domain-containing protein [Rahnella laticis]MBF7998903.1 helix-turn-helix domain-containing protein [Rahnella sp. LAC-M12]
MTITSDSPPVQLPMEKPLAALEELVSLFLPYATPLLEKRRGDGSLNLYENNLLTVALVTEGEVNIYHRSDMVLLATARAPFILGLQGSRFQYTLFKILPTKESKISLLPREKALKLAVKHRVFPHVLTYQTYLNDYQANRNNLLINRTSLHIVCGLLEELAKLKPEERLKTGVSKFVLTRSNLARSGIMKIIATLREEGYIIIENGKLIQIIKSLPAPDSAKNAHPI